MELAERSAAGPLRDRIAPGVRVLFVGINPGLRSAATGHHFAGYSNRFWKLLHESGLVSEPITYEQDDRLPEWGFGITNIVPRATAGIDELRPEDYRAGAAALLQENPPLQAGSRRARRRDGLARAPRGAGRNSTATATGDARLSGSHHRRRARRGAAQSERPQRHTDLPTDADRLSLPGRGRAVAGCVRLGTLSLTKEHRT